MSGTMTPMCDSESDGRLCCLPAAHDGDHAHVFTWADEPEPTTAAEIGIDFTPDPDRISGRLHHRRVDVNPEIRIIEAHLRAIQAVVDGARPQGSVEPEPTTAAEVKAQPEWQRIVGEYEDDYPEREPDLGYALSLLSDAADPTDSMPWALQSALAGFIVHCQTVVGNGWKADPFRYDDIAPASVTGILRALNEGTARRGIQKNDWECAGNHAAWWLAHLTGEVS